ncbi:hypothetical protein CRG98_010438 [Punica granatum]|uniref:Nuclear envelope integral membrane protein 1 n=1 Tax=Punica granatum TaxID=22663 RepID=A0A2I0KKY6_PUNGR|nr:hypothetical protein CRG98_010438 [Punica granatum]
MTSCSSLFVVLSTVFSLFFSTLVLIRTSAALEVPALKGVHPGQPILDVTPSPLSGLSPGPGSKDVLSCERVQISGQSRVKLGSYPNALRVLVVPSASTPDRLHSRIQICFHRNASLGYCRCEKDDWKAIHKGMWSSFMSPYEYRYVDLKLTGEVSGPITVSVVEEPQKWRLICLGLGFLMLLLAPVVSSWVPFYYSSSMAIGVLLVVIILLFQGMKLLPTGRKSAFYLTLYGSMLGAGSFLLHQFSMMVNALLVNFGLSEEMHNPVSLFLLIGIIIAGAALGYWIVRKFVISEDGTVDVGVAQFVKWAMRVVAATLIFQSTLDTLLALGALVLCSTFSYLISSPFWHEAAYESCSLNWSPSKQWSPQGTKLSRAEFLARTPPKGSQSKLWSRPKKTAAWLDSPVKGVVSPSSEARKNHPDYYSVLHKNPNRKKLSEQEWEDSKAHWTREAVSDLVSSPEFADWVIDHADRIRVVSSDSDEAVGSDSDSTNEVTAKSSNRLSLFSFWQFFY